MDQEEIIQLYKEMRRIRRFEEEATLLSQQYKIHTNLYSYKNREAIAVGATSVMEADDFVLSSCRGHGFYLARGGSMRELFAELLGHSGGCCGGNAGLLNIFDIEHRYIGGWSITGAQISIAAGFAYAQVYHDVPNVTLCFLSNDDLSNGLLYETASLEKKWELRLVFILQNQHTVLEDFKNLKSSIFIRPAEFNYDSINGLDLFAVRGAVHTAITAARESHLSSIIEAHTILENDTTSEEYDSLFILGKKLTAFGKSEARNNMDKEVEAEIQQSKRFLDTSTTANIDNSGD